MRVTLLFLLKCICKYRTTTSPSPTPHSWVPIVQLCFCLWFNFIPIQHSSCHVVPCRASFSGMGSVCKTENRITQSSMASHSCFPQTKTHPSSLYQLYYELITLMSHHPFHQSRLLTLPHTAQHNIFQHITTHHIGQYSCMFIILHQLARHVHVQLKL